LLLYSVWNLYVIATQILPFAIKNPRSNQEKGSSIFFEFDIEVVLAERKQALSRPLGYREGDIPDGGEVKSINRKAV